jgi:hypothetical protein
MKVFSEWIPVSALLDEGIDAIPKLKPDSTLGGRRDQCAGPPGIYSFRVKADRLGRGSRLATRVLTIGHTSDLTYRLGVFLGASQGFALWHSAGARFYSLKELLGLELVDLEYSFKVVPGNPKLSSNKKERLRKEAEATAAWRESLSADEREKLLALRQSIGRFFRARSGHYSSENKILPVLMTNEPGR